MTDAPAPLTDHTHDVTGLDGFMLNTDLLMASELWALASGDEFKAAVGLWCRAWKQTPPGSLPDDDRVLAAFSGAGRDWPKVREMALRGFVKCSDGRLYHRQLCCHAIRSSRAADWHLRHFDSHVGMSRREWRKIRREVFNRDGWKCVYCGALYNLQVDHVIAVSRGGTNDMNNLVCACRGCNQSKSNKELAAWEVRA